MNQIQEAPIAKHDRQSAVALSIDNFDYDAAHREGWTLSDYGRFKDGSPHIELQKLDNPHSGAAIFREDREAWAHVAQRARAGSPLHMQALALIDPRERMAIEASFRPR